ncbi:MAG: hypothetical protein AAGL98_08720, partial [Planctomycetota bacterium]
GMAFRMIAVNTHHYLQAAGRWSRYFGLNVIHGGAFILVCVVASYDQDLITLALAVSGFFAVYGVTQVAASLPTAMDRRIGRTLRLYAGGLLVSGIAAGSTLGLTALFHAGPAVTLGLRGVAMGVFSVLLIRWLLPDIYAVLVARLSGLLARRAAPAGR